MTALKVLSLGIFAPMIVWAVPPLGGTLNKDGASFRVWAPHAQEVSVRGTFRGGAPVPLVKEGDVFSGQVSEARAGDQYVYLVGGKSTACIDPETRTLSADRRSSILTPAPNARAPFFRGAPLEQAIIYELHVGSFNSSPTSPNGTFDSVRARLGYLSQLGINYIELLPVHASTHPFDWGYDPSSPDAIENNYGGAAELRGLVDAAHAFGIGVLLDVVHNHYAAVNALGCFGQAYFYPADHGTRWGPRPNFGEPFVRDYIANNIIEYLDEDHVDGFRWDAVPYITKFYDFNPLTKTETTDGFNPAGFSLLQQINSFLHRRPGVISIAEDFENDPLVTRSPSSGGLGFDSRWTGFFPVVHALTGPVAAINIAAIAAAIPGDNGRVIYTENHDEVGHPPRQRRLPTLVDPANPGSLNARKHSLLGAVMITTSPGIPMLFQGQEFLENQDFKFPEGTPLEWAKTISQQGVLKAYHDLIALRKNAAVLAGPGIQIFHQNESAKILAFRRFDPRRPQQLVVLANFGVSGFTRYRIGLPAGGLWKVVSSTDDKIYGADFGGTPRVRDFAASPSPYDGFNYSTTIELAPFSAVIIAN